MSLAEIQVELLRTEFPFLRPDHDPDIERYFEMRAAGRPGEALALYDSRLRPRYPDDTFRTNILRAYRLRDPSYRTFLTSAYENLGERLLERTKRTIKYISLRAGDYDRADAYSTIKAAESILAMLPNERFEAIAAIERLRRYADRIPYCERTMATAEDLVRAYLNESLDVVQAERSRRQAERQRTAAAHRRALVEQDKRDLERELRSMRNKKAEQGHAAAARRPAERQSAPRVAAILDLSLLRFSAADLVRIQIPPKLTTIEDKTLAFCFKYWNLVGDAAFERVLFLYSRKYGTKHYAVYSAISRGRKGGRRDEEILSAVSAILITGYYYSIRGDVYIQRNWVRLKAKLESPPSAQGDDESTRSSRPAAIGKRIRTPAKRAQAAPEPTSKKAAALVAKPEPAVDRRSMTEALSDTREDAKSHVPAPQKPHAGPGGSVSDRLKKLSGRSYDVYRDRFLAKVRTSIRTVLVKNKSTQRGLFASVPEEAEDLIFTFLRDHYADPYMDWAGGLQRERLRELGFTLETLDPVIEDCYRNLSGK